MHIGEAESTVQVSPCRSDAGPRSGVGSDFSHFMHFAALCCFPVVLFVYYCRTYYNAVRGGVPPHVRARTQVLGPLYVIIEYTVTHPLLLLLRVCPPPGYLGASSAHSLAAFLLQRLRPRLPHCVRLGLHLPRAHTRGRGKQGGDGRTRACEVSAGALDVQIYMRFTYINTYMDGDTLRHVCTTSGLHTTHVLIHALTRTHARTHAPPHARTPAHELIVNARTRTHTTHTWLVYSASLPEYGGPSVKSLIGLALPLGPKVASPSVCRANLGFRFRHFV